MIYVSGLKYSVEVIGENKIHYSIREYVQNLGWEENENEISSRIKFTAVNDKTDKGYLSRIIKPGCLVVISVSYGKTTKEVSRGYVEIWNPEEKNSMISLKCTCYDELYKLQQSQDNRYYSTGTGTKSAIQKIFDDWHIPLIYIGPNVTHGKMVYNNRYLSDIVMELLDDAVKRGGEKCIIRAEKGSAIVMPRGNNKTVYVFEVDNTKSFSQTVSTADLITRVRVVGTADDDGKHSIEATINGKTEYGIRQRIYTRGTDESLADAKTSAREILKKNGKIVRDISVQAPDIPFVHKGDLVYIISSTERNYYYVKSIQHCAESLSMSMQLEKAVDKDSQEDDAKKSEKAAYKVGDIVDYSGGIHYVSSYPGAKGYEAKAGKAKITMKDGAGKAHPWHLIHTDGHSNVHGWVDDGTFK